ncbi:ArsR/SmtB family transcription factor [Rhizobium rhizogenes]|jgi:DNA-binding transcriptional ArsR family regulator
MTVSGSWNIEAAAQLMAVMGNPKRLLILLRLTETEWSVRRLAKSVGLSDSSLSQHLAICRHVGLVETRRDAQTIFYSCKSEEVMTILEILQTFAVFRPASDET